MSIKRVFISGLVAVTVAASAILGAAQQSSAGGLSRGEAAAIAGIGGFIVGATIANSAQRHYPDYPSGYGGRTSSWEHHVDRCYARYRSYDHRTDTYLGYDGQYHYCQL
ncbi:MAG: BA14K family protein [Pseudaminobacter sp.]|nr:BA14K family protein [Pseudaminobacter sp.]